jgi:Z1 domain
MEDRADVRSRVFSERKATAINKAIRDLLALFTRSSYVGFTAAPFANIFIDPTSTDEMLGDDLFPRDFIHLLEPPTNYIGMDRVFPPVDPEQPGTGDEEAWAAGIRTVDDADQWLPVDHKQDVIVGPAPDSLLNALRHFLLTCAVRDLRARDGVNGRDKGIHRSMLVNVSRFTAVQNQVADQIHIQLETIRQQVRLTGN